MKKIIITCILIIFCLGFSACKSSDYNKALELEESQNYIAAAEIYENLNNYKDSEQHLKYCENMIKVVNEYNLAKESAENKNAELNALISEAEALITKKEEALDNTLLPILETAISDAKAMKINISDMPKTESDIIAETTTLNEIDYTDTINNLLENKSALEKSIKQYTLVNAPSEAYIIKCLKKVPNIIDISAVTEDNDPNGKLNKAGGYTAQVYFSSDLINQSSIIGVTVIEKGTNCGGSIEVYSTVEEANKRNEYLKNFDGSLFDSGSHTVIGTVIIRTSDELMASQQKSMETNIIAALTEIE